MFGLNFKTVLVAALSMTVMGEFADHLALELRLAHVYCRCCSTPVIQSRPRIVLVTLPSKLVILAT